MGPKCKRCGFKSCYFSLVIDTSFPLFPKHPWLACICLCICFSTTSLVVPLLPFFPNYSTKILSSVGFPIAVPDLGNIRCETHPSSAALLSSPVLSNVNTLHVHLFGCIFHMKKGHKKATTVVIQVLAMLKLCCFTHIISCNYDVSYRERSFSFTPLPTKSLWLQWILPWNQWCDFGLPV